VHFDEKGLAEIREGDVVIKIVRDNYEFRISENGVLLHTIRDVVVLPQEYNEYINTRKADDMRHENMP
jgi:hypothetical protein